MGMTNETLEFENDRLYHYCSKEVIQQKINTLRGESDE